MVVCAAPRYLETFGAPGHPSELEAAHHCVNYFLAQTNRVTPFEFERDGETVEITGRYILSVNDARSYLAAALAGLGVAPMPCFMAHDALSSGQLVPILPGWRAGPIPSMSSIRRTATSATRCVSSSIGSCLCLRARNWQPA